MCYFKKPSGGISEMDSCLSGNDKSVNQKNRFNRLELFY